MTEKLTKEERNELIGKMSALTGLSEDSINLLARWNEHEALSYKQDLISEMIMAMPDHVFDRYKNLQQARAENTGEDAEIAEGIASSIQQFLEYYKEPSLAECRNYAQARSINPCSRERLKRIKEELKKERE